MKKYASSLDHTFLTSNGAVLEVSFYGISEHPTEQSISIPKGLSEKELIFLINLHLYYIGKNLYINTFYSFFLMYSLYYRN